MASESRSPPGGLVAPSVRAYQRRERKRKAIIIEEAHAVPDLLARIEFAARTVQFVRTRASVWFRLIAVCLARDGGFESRELGRLVGCPHRYVLDKFTKRWDTNGCLKIFTYHRRSGRFELRVGVLSGLSAEAIQVLLSTAVSLGVRREAPSMRPARGAPASSARNLARVESAPSVMPSVVPSPPPLADSRLESSPVQSPPPVSERVYVPLESVASHPWAHPFAFDDDCAIAVPPSPPQLPWSMDLPPLFEFDATSFLMSSQNE